MPVIFADGLGRASVLMPSARLLRKMKGELSGAQMYSPPAQPASEEFSYWPRQGRTLNKPVSDGDGTGAQTYC